MEEVKAYNLTGELERFYEYNFFIGKTATVIVSHPVTLWCGMGHAFHRVWDGEQVHLCHAPGPIKDTDGNIIGLCKVTWIPGDSWQAVSCKPKDMNAPCSF